MPDFMRLDYESRSRIPLDADGVDIYTRDPSTGIMMAAWRNNDIGEIDFWDETMSRKPPKALVERLRDPEVLKWAFNAQFERLMTERVWGIKTPHSSWRCTMVLAYIMGFSGGLAKIGTAMGFDETKLKDPMGKKLINMFCKPRTPTKADSRIWFNANTHPTEYGHLGAYNRQDVKAESAIGRRLEKFPIAPGEWELYGIDQYINDTGITIDVDFARNALAMADARKPVIIEEMRDLTGLANPNSPAQLGAWLRERGYPFADLRADTVKKVIYDAAKLKLEPEVVKALELRQNSSKSSLAKYTMMLRSERVDCKFRYSIQFRGAARTGRYGGRDLQPQNMMRTPGWLEDEAIQAVARRMILKKDMSGLKLLCGEPMDALAGMMRGAIIPSAEHEFVVADLASIESVVIAWVTGCKWMQETLAAGRDLYVQFASMWLKLAYEDAVKHRKKAKPATLGAGFRLGGGGLMPDGKKGGLWGYAENMGIFITQKEAADSVRAFREMSPEIVEFWYALERAVARCLTIKSDVKCGKVTMEYRKPFLAIKLPSGRRLYYFRPRIVSVEKRFVDPQTGEQRLYTQREFHYEGMGTKKKVWGDQASHGGKLCIAEDTKVLTDSGWKAIQLVQPSDRVWDGVEWVSQNGCVLNGEKEVIKAHGAWMTHDHLVLTEKGWKSASESGRYNRAACRLPDGVKLPRIERSSFAVEHRMCVRRNHTNGGVRVQKTGLKATHVVVRLYEEKEHRGVKRGSWHVPTSGVLGLAEHGRPMLVAIAPGLEKLRFQRDKSLRPVENIPAILAGHGADISTRPVTGAQGQRQGLQPGQLLLGEREDTGPKSSINDVYRNTGGAGNSSRTGGAHRTEPEHDTLPYQTRLDAGAATGITRRNAKVYDLINCGPRHRFVIATDGGPLIVHNCENIVQAIANDILNLGIVRAFKDGFRIPFHVHDEIITEVPIGQGQSRLKRLIQLMTDDVPWAPGLKLGAAGWVGMFYRKD